MPTSWPPRRTSRPSSRRCVTRGLITITTLQHYNTINPTISPTKLIPPDPAAARRTRSHHQPHTRCARHTPSSPPATQHAARATLPAGERHCGGQRQVCGREPPAREGPAAGECVQGKAICFSCVASVLSCCICFYVALCRCWHAAMPPCPLRLCLLYLPRRLRTAGRLIAANPAITGIPA